MEEKLQFASEPMPEVATIDAEFDPAEEREAILDRFANTPMAYTVNGVTHKASGSHEALLLCSYLQSESLSPGHLEYAFEEAAELAVELDAEKPVEDEVLDEADEEEVSKQNHQAQLQEAGPLKEKNNEQTVQAEKTESNEIRDGDTGSALSNEPTVAQETVSDGAIDASPVESRDTADATVEVKSNTSSEPVVERSTMEVSNDGMEAPSAVTTTSINIDVPESSVNEEQAEEPEPVHAMAGPELEIAEPEVTSVDTTSANERVADMPVIDETDTIIVESEPVLPEKPVESTHEAPSETEIFQILAMHENLEMAEDDPTETVRETGEVNYWRGDEEVDIEPENDEPIAAVESEIDGLQVTEESDEVTLDVVRQYDEGVMVDDHQALEIERAVIAEQDGAVHEASPEVGEIVAQLVGQSPNSQPEATVDILYMQADATIRKVENLERARTAEDCRESLEDLRMELATLLQQLGYTDADAVAERLTKQYDIATLKKYIAVLMRSFLMAQTKNEKTKSARSKVHVPYHRYGAKAVQMVVSLVSAKQRQGSST